jgi:hemerythrin-like metal-binding protein
MTDDLLTGIKDIDDQHRVFFAWGNRILMTPDLDRDRPAFARAIRFLGEYATFHFSAEEFAMELFAFPGAAIHRSWHAQFKARVAELETRAHAEGLSRKVQLEVYYLIQDWFPQHIRSMDRQFAEFLSRSEESPRLPGADDLRQRGVPVPDEEEVRVVRVEGEMSASELKARSRSRPKG